MMIFYNTMRALPNFGIWNLVNSMFRAKEFIDNPISHLKSTKLNQDEIAKINQEIAKKMLTEQNNPEIKDLREKIWKVYYLNYLYKKTYELNPSLDKKNLKTWNDRVKTCCTEAFTECLFQTVGIKYIEHFTKTFFEVNLKDEWQREEYWLEICYKLGLSENAKNAVSAEKRKKLDTFISTLPHEASRLFAYPNEGRLSTINDVDARKYAINKVKKIQEAAYQTLHKMSEMIEIFGSVDQLLYKGEESSKSSVAHLNTDEK